MWTTVDNKEIKPGLMVWHYDWYWSRIKGREWQDRGAGLGREIDDERFDGWFTVETWSPHVHAWLRGMIYNGERMTTVCPNCQGTFVRCNESGCGQRKEPYWVIPQILLDVNGHPMP
jgi:hypothetical protein